MQMCAMLASKLAQSTRIIQMQTMLFLTVAFGLHTQASRWLCEHITSTIGTGCLSVFTFEPSRFGYKTAGVALSRHFSLHFIRFHSRFSSIFFFINYYNNNSDDNNNDDICTEQRGETIDNSIFIIKLNRWQIIISCRAWLKWINLTKQIN